MSPDPDTSDGGSDAETEGGQSPVVEGDEVFYDLLGSSGGRELLAALGRTPRPVSEIADQCSVSRATVYRHLEKLRQLGLVEERETIGETGGRVTEVRLTVGTAAVSFANRVVELRFVPVGATDRFEWLLNALADAATKPVKSPSANERSTADASVETERDA